MILFVPHETAFARAACPSSQANIPANEAENSPDDLSRQMQHIHAGRPSGRDGLSPTVLCSTPSWTPLAMPSKPHMDHGDSSCCCHDQWHIATSKRVPETPINKILSYLATLFEPKESKVPNLHDAFAIADFFGAAWLFMLVLPVGSLIHILLLYRRISCPDSHARLSTMRQIGGGQRSGCSPHLPSVRR